MSDVFVTYRWENDAHNKKVIALVNYLRENGYDATMDRLESQKETARDFIKMMHQAMTDYPKVIIVLSEGYKSRADGFEGGVGNEYGLIIKDIDSNPRKYILVSFQEIKDSITPLNFKGREIIHLTGDESYNRLHAKLQDEVLVEFSPVAKTKPSVKVEAAATLHIPQASIEILGFQANWGDMGTTKSGGQYVYVSYKLELILKNNSTKSIADYTVEISMPKFFIDYTKVGKIRDSDVFITLSSNPKIYPGQEVLLEPIQLQIREGRARLAAESKIYVKVYTDTGIVEKYYPLMEFLFDTKYGEKRPLSLDDFA